jgi:hypothetical protein
MEKTNTPQYNTKYVNSFRDFDPKKEKESLKKVNRSFNKNEDDIYELPNNNKPHFNNVTKTMQFLSKDEIKDKIEAIDDMEEKKESKIFNWNKFNEMYEEPMDAGSDKYQHLNPLPSSAFDEDSCEGCGEHPLECTCDQDSDRWCDICGEDVEGSCDCVNHEDFPSHEDSRDPYDSEYDI